MNATPKPGEVVRLARKNAYGTVDFTHASVVSSAGNMVVSITGVHVTLQKRNGAYAGGGYELVPLARGDAFDVLTLDGELIDRRASFNGAMESIAPFPRSACVVRDKRIVAWGDLVDSPSMFAATKRLHEMNIIVRARTP
jgi:hypothetical protein